MRTAITPMIQDETGATLIEYALLVSLIAVVALTAIQTFGLNLETLFSTFAGAV